MNVEFFKYSCVLFAALGSTASFADKLPQWVSSYKADGTCYCAPVIHPSLKNKIVATPVGGQSIEQVCARIGEGPGLVLDNGVFNFPAYHDAQCGNGPFAVDPSGCEGRMEVEDTICTGSGPEWDLKPAYARKATVVPEQSAVDKAAEAKRAKELGAKARARSEKEEAKRARELAAIAWQKNIQKSAAAEQKLAENLAEQARLKAVEVEEAADAEVALELAEKERQQVAENERVKRASLLAEQAQLQSNAPVVAEVTQSEKQSEEDIEDARLAKQLAVKALAEREKADAQKIAKARAAKAKAALAESVDEKVEPAATPEATIAGEAETKDARIRAAAVRAAQLRAAEASATRDAENKLAKSDKINNAESSATSAIEPAMSTAVRVPSPAVLSEHRNGFVEVAPVSYDYGGAGASLSGSVLMGSSWQMTGRAAAAEEYTEVMVGIARSFAPQSLSGGELKIVGGLEHGNFDLGITELTDSGIILGSSLGFDVGSRANLSAGLHYSSFFEGDPAAFGQLLFRVVQNLDFSTRVEGGDNTNLSLGLRYHY